MTGQYLGVRSDRPNQQPQSLQRPFEAAAIIGVNGRKCRCSEHVTRVNHIGFREMNERVAVCMRRRNREGVNLLTVQMNDE